MRKSIIISLLLGIVVKALPCAYVETHNYYIFRVFHDNDFKYETNQVSLQNWSAYTGKDMYWFDADAIRSAARQKGDELMLSYVDHLVRYVKVADDAGNDHWSYPTKEELAKRRQELLSIRAYAQQKLTSKLRSQHGLLFMRCNMMLDRHAENVTFYEQTASRYIESVYRDMMRNIYAGALLKTGRKSDATRIFVEQGDERSLYTQYDESRSLEAIRREYQEDPNSPALPFLLQDFAQNAQEAYDVSHGGWGHGKFYVRDIKQDEGLQMASFAHQVVDEGKTENPALWKALEAWLYYLFADRQQALETINQAAAMRGTPVIEQNARILQLYIRAEVAKVDQNYYRQLADGLTWLEQLADEERTRLGDHPYYENFYTRVYDRLVHQVLVEKFDEMGLFDLSTALLGSYDEMPKQYARQLNHRTTRQDPEYPWNDDYNGDFFSRLDTIPVGQVESYVGYLQRGGEGTPLDEWLMKRVRHDNEFFSELIGTKYMRLGQWKKAIEQLEGVSLDFINTMNISPYMAQRSYSMEPWIQRQRLKEEQEQPGAALVKASQKLDYARTMLQLEQSYLLLGKNERQQAAYDLAVRYYQASYAGECWYLMHYGTGYADAPLPGEQDLLAKAQEKLKTAQSTGDFLLKEKTFFALAYVPTDEWLKHYYSYEAQSWVDELQPSTQKYKALKALADFEQKNASRTSSYVSRCDVLKQFIKKQ